MWELLWLPLLCSDTFRKMIACISLTVGTAILSRYQQAKALVHPIKKIAKVGWYCCTQIWAGNSAMLKDLAVLEVRCWLIKNMELGDLQVLPKKYILTYYVGSRRYKIHFPKKRGPRNIVSVRTNDTCITEEVFEAMGPSHNFHGIETTPELLGYPHGVTVKYRVGKTVHYEKTETICL